MNILFVTTKTPLPMDDGHSLRDFNILRQLAKKHRIHLISAVKARREWESLNELQKICASVQLVAVPANRSKLALAVTLINSLLRQRAFVVSKYNLPGIRQAIRKTLAENTIDLIHLSVLPLAVYLDEVAGYPVTLDEHNVESALLRQRLTAETGIRRLFFRWQQEWLEIFERDAVRRADHILACSKIDASLLRQLAPGTPVSLIANGVDRDYFQPQIVEEEKESLVFVGGLDWHPNIDGLHWFDREILPQLIIQHPDLRLHVIGGGPQPQWRHKDHIVCHGRVEDIRPYMARAAIFIVPLRIGGGTRLKILNAMATGCCVVATGIGAAGLDAVDGENILIGDSAQDFAARILTALATASFREQIARKAVQFIEDNYDWNLIGEKLRAEISSLARKRDDQP